MGTELLGNMHRHVFTTRNNSNLNQRIYIVRGEVNTFKYDTYICSIEIFWWRVIKLIK
jgi:hypothetical protein